MSKLKFQAAKEAFQDAINLADKKDDDILMSIANGLLKLTEAVEINLDVLESQDHDSDD